MFCHIGRITIVKNEGTIIFGNVSGVPNSTPQSNQGSTGSTGSTDNNTGEVSLDNSRFSLTVPIQSIVLDDQIPKEKKKDRNTGMARGSKAKRARRPSDA